MRARRFVGASGVALFVALGCGDGTRQGAPATASSEGDGTGPFVSEGAAEPAPWILSAPDGVAAGGWVYAMIDRPLSAVIVELHGRDLGEPSSRLYADMPGGVWRVPDDLAPGPGALTVRLRADPEVATTHAMLVWAPRFSEVADATGLAQVHDATGSPPECAESHTGLAFGDVDGDARPDVLVGNVGSGLRMFAGEGDRSGDGLPDFRDITAAVGLAGIDAVAMATFVDLEGDGDLDLFVGRRGTNRMLENRRVPDGALEFRDVTAAVGLGVESQRTMGAAFGDYDADGDLDLYVVNHAFCFPEQGSDVRADDHLYRNDDGVFVERTQELGPVTASVGFSAAWVDVERDGDPDLVVINDAVGGMIGRPNALWRNDGAEPDGTGWRFTDVSEASGVAIAGANGMGLALGDLDDDGFVDLAFTDIGPNHVLMNAGDGTFVDVAAEAGVERRELPWARTSITWAAHMFDHDHDGDLDLYFSGGRIKGPAPIPDAFFDNRGDGTFADLTWSGGLADPDHGKASGLVDLDRDGAWDLVTANWGGPLRVYRNRAVPPGRHWLVVELRGVGKNRDALGAIVELTVGDRTLTCFHSGRPALGGGGETACHFGLGDVATVDGLRVHWPDGLVDDRPVPEVDRRIEVVHPAG
jgi:enediyne biosynthesis protein E4